MTADPTRARPVPALRLLGPVRVDLAGEAVRLRPAERRLLAILCLAPGRELTQEELIDRMWGEEPPRTARTALQMHISAVRRAVDGIITRTADGYRVGQVDDDRSEVARLALEAEATADLGRWEEVLALTDRALSRWYGVPLLDLADDPWVAPELRRLEALRSRLVDARIRALMALDRNDEVVELARDELADDPLDEGRWCDLILALAGTGRVAEALRECGAAAATLRAEVGAEPGPALRDLERRIRFEDPDLGAAPGRPSSHNLPTTSTSFIDREKDLRAIQLALTAERCCTVMGAPGVGKTRLAIEAARVSLDRYPDGVWFVPLAGAKSERDVLGAITTATRTHTQLASLSQLAAHLGARRALVILDNCEHLAVACRTFVEAVLATDGTLRLLVTSRSQIEIPGEVWRLQPLELPAAGPRSHTEGQILATPSVRLFIERARSADPSFRLTPQTVPMAVDVCRSAAGVPLAIELAASWLPAIGVADLREILGPGLTRRERLPTGSRESSSLRAAIDRSMSLLPPSDLRLLRNVAIFAGPFTLADVRAICAPNSPLSEVAAEIARLVEASLLVVERRRSGKAIYRLLVPIREHLLEAPSQDEPAVRAAFVEHYLAKARAWCPDPLATGSDLEAIDDDMENIREALDANLAGDDARAGGWAILALHGYFYDRYLVWEGMRWDARALERVTDPELRGWLLRAQGSGAHNVNDLEVAARTLAQAVRLFRQLRHRDGTVMCLLSIAQVHATRGEWDACRRAAERARRLLGPGGNRSGHAVATYYVGESLAYQGEMDRAIPELGRAGRLFEETRQPHRAAYALATLTMTAVLGGYEAAARRYGPRAVELARGSGSGYRLTRALGAMAACEATWGDPLVARQLLEEAREHLGPMASDTVVDFLLPAGYLLQQADAWEWLVDLLAHVEATAAHTTTTLSRPWREQLDAWRQEAARRMVLIENRRVFEALPGEELVTRTINALDGHPGREQSA